MLTIVSKLITEQPDRLDYVIAEMNQAWNDRFTFLRPKFLERYLNGELAIHFHSYRHTRKEPNTQDFCAIFCRPNDMNGAERRRKFNKFLVGDLRWMAKAEVLESWDADGNDDKQCVLIGNAHIMENRERIVRRVGMSSCMFEIRLTSLKDCQSCGGDRLFMKLSGGYEFLGRGADGEICPESFRRVESVFKNKRPHQMIESRSQVMNNLTNENGETQRWRSGWSEYAKDVLSRLVIHISNDSIIAGTNKGFYFEPEIFDILVGPLNLCPTSVEWRCHGIRS